MEIHARYRKSQVVCHLLVLASALLLVSRADLLPDWVYARSIQLTERDRPFDLIFASEKLLIGAVLLLSVRALYGFKFSGRDLLGTVRATGLWSAVAVLALIGPALLLHFVAFEPKLPEVTLAWAVNNLFFVCMIEEIFFRSYLFEAFRRNRLLANRPAYAVALSALLFGLSHLGGGWAFVFLASIAGFAYTRAYVSVGLMGSTVTHCLVNFAHFLLFSYPALIERGH